MTYLLPLTQAELDLLVEMAELYVKTNLGSQAVDPSKVVIADELACRISTHKKESEMDLRPNLADCDRFNTAALQRWARLQRF